MCRYCNWEEAKEKCEEMLADLDFAFADDTITGILEWIEENEHITEKQEEAIENIANSVYRRM